MDAATAAAASSSAPGAAPRAPTAFATAALRVFDLSVGQMLWSRRTIFLALVVGSPVVLGLLIRILDAYGIGGVRMGAAQVMPGPSIFGLFMWLLYLRFIVPVLGVFYGTSLIADEVDDRTITYLFTRPIPRGAVLAGKYLAYLVVTGLVVLPSVMIVYALIVPPGGGNFVRSFPDLVKDLGLLAIGLTVYGALFAWIGAQLRHPLVIGLVFAFGWEQAVLVFPGYLRRFTVAYYLQGLVPHAMPVDNTVSMLQAVFRDAPSVLTCLGWLLVFWAVFLYLAARAVDRREYVLEQ